MIKEFSTNDILKAVNNISKMEKKKNRALEKKDFTQKDDALTPDKQAKSDNSEILVLDQMIE